MNLEQEIKSIVPDFDLYAANWIGVTVPATCKPSTESDYKGILKNHVSPIFGKIPVSQISRLMVKNFLMKKVNDGYASSTVTHMKNAISGVLNLAVDEETIPVNPAHNLGKIFKKQSSELQVDPYNKDELKMLLDIYHKHFPNHYPMVLTLSRTGIRFGEALGLRWGDIDFDGRFITIQRSLSRCKVESPKNGKSRKVDMSRQLTDVLRRLYTQRKKETLNKGWKYVPEWVFISSEGTPLNDSNWRKRVFYKALDMVGLRKVRIHDLRHSYATIRIVKGDNIADVSKQLGHHSVKLTMDIYYHWIPGGNKSEVDELDDFDLGATKRNLSATTFKKPTLLSL